MTVARILIVEDERIIAKDLERRLQRLGYTVVGLAVTGYTDDATICQTMAVSPRGYIRKPFHERELQATIEQALSRRASDNSA